MRHNSKGREGNCFDFLRLFAACSVVVSHATNHFHSSFLWVHPGQSVWFYDGVALFFVLSGFLVYRSYERCVQRGHPSWQYFVNRFLRIAPALYAYLAFTTLALILVGVLPIGELGRAAYWKWAGSNLLLLPRNSVLFLDFGTGNINGSLWTVTAEISFYLVVPLIYVVQRRYGLRAMLAFIAVAGLAGVIMAGVLGRESRWVYRDFLFRLTFLPYMIFFGLGIFWSQVWDQAPKRRWLCALCVSLFGAIRILNIPGLEPETGLGLVLKGSINPIYAVVWAVPLSYAVIYVAHFGPRIFRMIPQKIGDLSYGIYIWHMVVINFMVYFGWHRIVAGIPGAGVGLALLITFALAALSWRLVEKPAVRFKPYSSRRSRELDRPLTSAESAAPFADQTHRLPIHSRD